MKFRRIISKLFLWMIGIACISLFLIPIEDRILWGYWISRPTLENELDNIDSLLGVSLFSLENGSTMVQREDWKHSFVLAVRAKKDLHSFNEFLYLRPVIVLNQKQKLEDLPPEVDNDLLNRIWKQILHEGWMPKVRDPKYIKSGVPVAGTAIHFRKGHDEKLIIAYYTGEISNDRYGYAEVLYIINGLNMKFKKQIHFYFEIAGLEFLTWKVLLIINTGILLILSVIYWLVKRNKKKKQKGSGLHRLLKN